MVIPLEISSVPKGGFGLIVYSVDGEVWTMPARVEQCNDELCCREMVHMKHGDSSSIQILDVFTTLPQHLVTVASTEVWQRRLAGYSGEARQAVIKAVQDFHRTSGR